MSSQRKYVAIECGHPALTPTTRNCKACHKTKGTFCLRGHDTRILGRTDKRVCVACEIDRGREKNANRTPQEDKKWKLRYRYGLARHQFDALLESQAHCCAICKEPLTKPMVDHDHSTGKIRGVLCIHCNFALGSFKDDPSRIIAAAKYLVR